MPLESWVGFPLRTRLSDRRFLSPPTLGDRMGFSVLFTVGDRVVEVVVGACLLAFGEPLWCGLLIPSDCGDRIG